MTSRYSDTSGKRTGGTGRRTTAIFFVAVYLPVRLPRNRYGNVTTTILLLPYVLTMATTHDETKVPAPPEEPSDSAQDASSSTEHSVLQVCTILRQQLDNMGRALRCSICMETFCVDPPRSRGPCVLLIECKHAFCQTCIHTHLRTTLRCPECNTSITSKRSCYPQPLLPHAAVPYKRALQAFGLTPVQYTAQHIQYTQLAPGDADDTPHQSNHNDVDNSDSNNETQLFHENLHFAQTARTMQWAVREAAAPNNFLDAHQRQVVTVNERVLAESAATRKAAREIRRQAERERVRDRRRQVEAAMLLSQNGHAAREQHAADYQEQDSSDNDNNNNSAWQYPGQAYEQGNPKVRFDAFSATLPNDSDNGNGKMPAIPERSPRENDESQEYGSAVQELLDPSQNVVEPGQHEEKASSTAAAANVASPEANYTSPPGDGADPQQPLFNHNHNNCSMAKTPAASNTTAAAAVRTRVFSASSVAHTPAVAASNTSTAAAALLQEQPSDRSPNLLDTPSSDDDEDDDEEDETTPVGANDATVPAAAEYSAELSRTTSAVQTPSVAPAAMVNDAATVVPATLSSPNLLQFDSPPTDTDANQAVPEQLQQSPNLLPLINTNADDDDDDFPPPADEETDDDDDFPPAVVQPTSTDTGDMDVETSGNKGETMVNLQDDKAEVVEATDMDVDVDEATSEPPVPVIDTNANVPLAAATSLSLPRETPQSQQHQTLSRLVYDVGSVVLVQARTWPGVNKQGGVGHVAVVHTSPDGSFKYDVKYVLGGQELQVDDSFVSLQGDEKGLSMQVGASGGRVSRRLAGKQDELPPQLLAELEAKGYDTQGDATRALLEGNKQQQDVKENTKSVQKKIAPSNKRTPSSAVLARTKENTKPSSKRKPKSAVSSQKKRKTSEKGTPSAAQPQVPCLGNMTDEEKCDLADTLYTTRINAAVRKRTIQVVASSLPSDIMEALQQLCKATKNSKGTCRAQQQQPKQKTLEFFTHSFTRHCAFPSSQNQDFQ